MKNYLILLGLMLLFKSTSSQGFSEIPVLLRSLLLSGISSDTDFCDDDETFVEDYIGIIFPRLVCSFDGWFRPINNTEYRLAAVFDCIGSKFLVIEFNNVFTFIGDGNDRDDVSLNFDCQLLTEDEIDDQFEYFDEGLVMSCEEFYIMLRCLIYRKCDELFDHLNV